MWRSDWMSWCRQIGCASVSYQLILDQFHAVILSGMSESPPADGDRRDETYYSAGRRSGSPPSSLAHGKDQVPSREPITVSILHFNEKNQKHLRGHVLIRSSCLVTSTFEAVWPHGQLLQIRSEVSGDGRGKVSVISSVFIGCSVHHFFSNWCCCMEDQNCQNPK